MYMKDFGIKKFFDDIAALFSAPSVIGIDIGTVSIKLIEVSRNAGVMKMENYGILETRKYLRKGNAALQTSSAKIVEEEAIPLVRTLIAETRPRTRNVIASIPAFAAFFVTIEIPVTADAELAKTIQFQAKQYIPVPIDEVNLEWVRVGEFQNEHGQTIRRYFLTAIPNVIVEKYTRIFKEAGLNLISLEVETQTLARSLLSDSSPLTMIMDMGGWSTEFIVVEKGVVKKVSQTDYGGVTLTEALARAHGLPAKNAEEVKRGKGLFGDVEEGELSTSLLPFLDVILQEGERVRREFERIEEKNIEEIIVVGGSANLLGLDNYLKNHSTMKVRQPDCLSRYAHGVEVEPIMKTLNKDLATVSGLALRRFI